MTAGSYSDEMQKKKSERKSNTDYGEDCVFDFWNVTITVRRLTEVKCGKIQCSAEEISVQEDTLLTCTG